MRILAVQFSLLAILLAGWNWVLVRATSNVPAKKLIQKVRATHDASHLFLGNSLTASGMDEAAFKSAFTNSDPLNIALGFSMPIEHFVVLKEFLKLNQAKVLLYGFFDFQLTEPVRGKWNEIMGNQSISLHLDPSIAASLYHPQTKLNQSQILWASQIPMILERASLWGRVDAMRRKCEEFGMPKKEANTFGRVADFELLQSKDEAEFQRKCSEQSRWDFNEPLKEILKIAREKKIQVVLVEMPLSPSHQNRFYARPEWKVYKEHLRKISGESGASYLVASDWVKDPKFFADVLHLNPEGAVEFSRKLAEWSAGQ